MYQVRFFQAHVTSESDQVTALHDLENRVNLSLGPLSIGCNEPPRVSGPNPIWSPNGERIIAYTASIVYEKTP